MKKICALLLCAAMLFSLTACGEIDETTESTSQSSKTATEKDTDTEWAIYWYLCGSDLETNYGAATSDLDEMMEVELPENVKIVIQTGGAATWQNDIISADKLQRYVYDSTGLNLIEEQPLANMGEAATLESFLKFASENYPAKRTMVNFWNHGGGSVTGAAFDELHEMDYLSLIEMQQAMSAALGEDTTNQPLDIIGFDTCLMATVDTANALSGIGKYLVASEELEPGNGWLYSGIMKSLAGNPTIEPFELSKAICDSYMEGCVAAGTEDNTTLSVTNLSKIGNLVTAYDNFGKEALASAVESPAFFNQFSRVAGAIENYGGNTREQGFTNMADLGHLARSAVEFMPDTTQAVISALADCVEYKVSGKYRKEATGLSCYYSYNGDIDDFAAYSKVGPSPAFNYFYEYGLTGTLPEDGMKYISEMSYEELPDLVTLKSVKWDNAPVTVDDDGVAALTLGKTAADVLSSITFQLYYVDVQEDIMLCLGTDNDINMDWTNGVFKDNFRGVWGSLDGSLCYMEITYECEEYNLYSIPILLNGEEYNLSVVFDFADQTYYIEGARKGLAESGAADKNIRELVVGDEIQTVHYASALSDESDELTSVPMDKITVTSETTFSEAELGDGMFIMIYEMSDSQGNFAYSAPFSFEIKDGEIFTSVE